MVTYEDILRYLNSEMPDIGGIFPAPVVNDPDPDPDPDLDPTDQVLTPEQLFLLQQQQRLALGENDRDNSNVIDTTNNAGLTGIEGLLTALGFVTNPFATLAYQSGKKGLDNFKNTGNLFGNPNNIYRGKGEGSNYGIDLNVANMAKARGLTKQLNKVPIQRGPNERDQGVGETGGGTFGSSTNDSNFSDYS